MWQGMKSVVVISPQDTEKERGEKFNQWTSNNHKSSLADRNIPNVLETRKMLYGSK